MVDWKPVTDLLDSDATIPGMEEAKKRAEYVTAMKAAIEAAKARDNDNKRAATLIAVDAAKTFVQIAIALVVAILGFIQFSYRNVTGSLLVMLAIAAILAFVSMCAGFIVISKVYKKGDGRIPSPDVPWSTYDVKNPINVQAITGVVALAVFASALVVFNAGAARPRQLNITMPDGSTTVRSNVAPLILTGRWTELAFEQRSGLAVSVPPSSTGDAQSVRIDVR
jgi:hypothetical protein